MNRTSLLFASALGLGLGLTVLGCSEKKNMQQVLTTGPTVTDGGAALAAPDASLPPSQFQKVQYSESDFVDSDENRDPFRSYASLFDDTKKDKRISNQRNVLLSQYGIDELKLAAIVTGGDYPRAMVIDPAGKGWVLKRGDFLGRSDTVHVGGANGTDYQLNWRVDRVRDGDVVLVRDDPAQPNVPPSTRVLNLHPEGEPKAQLD